MRVKKVQLRDFLLKLTDDLNKIHQEIPKSDHKFGPPIPQISDDDFPEMNLEVVVQLPPSHTPPKPPEEKRIVPVCL